ncbi:ribbon-helix-helix protein, CopG family [Cellulomonas sp. URHB0016]
MAMTLRLSEEEAAILRDLAEAEHRSMNDVVVLAIRDRAARRVGREASTEAIARLIERDRDLLDRLAK